MHKLIAGLREKTYAQHNESKSNCSATEVYAQFADIGCDLGLAAKNPFFGTIFPLEKNLSKPQHIVAIVRVN
jgi:hypothetical protein